MRRVSAASRYPGLPRPIGQNRRRDLGHPLPPHITLRRLSNISENRIALNCLHTIRIRLRTGARGNAEIPRFRIDSVKMSVLARLDPGNILTDGFDLPAVKTFRWHQHRKIRLAAGTWKRRRHVSFFTFGACDSQNQHVFRQPPLIARHHRCNP